MSLNSANYQNTVVYANGKLSQVAQSEKEGKPYRKRAALTSSRNLKITSDSELIIWC